MQSAIRRQGFTDLKIISTREILGRFPPPQLVFSTNSTYSTFCRLSPSVAPRPFFREGYPIAGEFSLIA